MADDSTKSMASTDRLSSLEAFAAPSLDPIFWQMDELGISSQWLGHVPFGYWIVSSLQPRLLVELETQAGVSYSAFCQAVAAGQLNTQCYTLRNDQVDLASGGSLGEGRHEFRRFHDGRYAAFSTLLCGPPDQLRSQFQEGTVDLLHIACYSTYDELKCELEAWLPKLSERAVVLLFNTNNYCVPGVIQMWDEIRQQYPSFEFLHGEGLGLLAIGSQVPRVMNELCQIADPSQITRLRSRFCAVGERWVRAAQERRLLAELERRTAEAGLEAERLQQDIAFWKAIASENERARDQIAFRVEIARKDLYVANMRAEEAAVATGSALAQVEVARAREAEAAATTVSALAQLEDARAREAHFIGEQDAIHLSRAWRVATLLRRIGHRYPRLSRWGWRIMRLLVNVK